MKPKPRWMQSVIAAAKEEGDTPLFVGRRKQRINVTGTTKLARA